jgi:hypothetical protein
MGVLAVHMYEPLLSQTTQVGGAGAAVLAVGRAALACAPVRVLATRARPGSAAGLATISSSPPLTRLLCIEQLPLLGSRPSMCFMRQGRASRAVGRGQVVSCGWDCLEVCVGAHDLHKAYPDTKFT